MGKIYKSGHWPNSNPDTIMTDLKINQCDIDQMNRDVQKHEIDQALDQLHAGTSAGTTDIPPELLRNLGWRSRRYIWGWAQNTWQNNDPPEQNDMLRTTFLHKKGATDTLDNYRTLTTGCNLCKVFNRMLTNRIQDAVEESNILGEIQNGFRKGRRATDNLLVLETILRKTKRNKKKNFMALLDITKAYDRVDRDLLWIVMEQMEFPKQLLDNLKSSYRDPKSVVHSQNIQSEPLKLKLGLKQGCVMSPVLFSIYIAELGNRLMKSELGITLGDKKIPGMFFADDMMLIGNEKELKDLLQIVGEYSQQFKLEFSGAKSSIIPLGGPIVQDRVWKLGEVFVNELEAKEINISETSEGRYLGVTIQKNYSLFKPQWEIAMQKARRGAGLVTLLARRCSNPLTVMKPLWQSYILPAVLYGTEIMDYCKSHIQNLDIIQKGMMKSVLRVMQGTSSAGCYAITGLSTIEQEIWKKKLSYYVHITRMSETKWAKIAFGEQLNWGIKEKTWDTEGIQRNTHIKSTKKYWLNELYVMANHFGMEKVEETEDERKTELRLPNDWNKQHIKTYTEGMRIRRLTEDMKDQTSLQWLGPIHQDHEYDSRSQSWWLKGKIGSIRTKTRDNHLGKCPLCFADNEDVTHFLECNAYPEKPVTEIIDIDVQNRHIWPWLFHFDRHYDIRVKLSQWIQNRWKTRINHIQMRDNHIPLVAENNVRREILDPSTENPRAIIAIDTSQNTVDNPAPCSSKMRRGPDRACKKKR
ncbi:MAG: reverse transcriptase family protein [Maribacter sp.]|nr:reverse transcriptase family protein [Maribacter sp.]